MKDRLIEYYNTHCTVCSCKISVPSTYNGRYPTCGLHRPPHKTPIERAADRALAHPKPVYAKRGEEHLNIALSQLLKEEA